MPGRACPSQTGHSLQGKSRDADPAFLAEVPAHVHMRKSISGFLKILLSRIYVNRAMDKTATRTRKRKGRNIYWVVLNRSQVPSASAVGHKPQRSRQPSQDLVQLSSSEGGPDQFLWLGHSIFQDQQQVTGFSGSLDGKGSLSRRVAFSTSECLEKEVRLWFWSQGRLSLGFGASPCRQGFHRVCLSHWGFKLTPLNYCVYIIISLDSIHLQGNPRIFLMVEFMPALQKEPTWLSYLHKPLWLLLSFKQWQALQT